MNGFLLDENLPSQIRFTPTLKVYSTRDIGSQPTDGAIWNFALRRKLVIITKDADFSERIIVSSPPPWVVHLRFGNLRRADFHALLQRAWPQIETLIKSHKLLNVFPDRIEGVH